ncbi:diguanylate cyclase [Pantoea ananatis]|uniref:diguanylate cyclase n=1 Tax=Pantoea ananas TaxID=553 RepID=UPI000496B560|nr:diguanylate cyclase [Pantoea ananatis]ASN18022.1 GGDEF domain-containing protein [Pantoea ananatis]PQK73321.1 GGDEF domain-containing protein [Pantoea ananatis]CRH31768.1 Diguanylate cyclase YaiC {ECO:0000313/EMBL:AER34713.1} [Pantoea ananatis]CRH40810.1 Diguanylate cyclase YaiC {ECO:0000313/EMBL:AER34713.1} [Pantoea ananatis]
MTYYSPDDHHLKMRSTRFVRRMFAMRQLGTLLCFLPIASVLLELGKEPAILVLLISNVLIWPYLAYRLAVKSRDSTARERSNLTLDAAFGGIWIALMAVSPMPSFVIIAVLMADRYAAGGWPQLLSAAQAFLFAFILVWTIEGAPVLMEFSTRTAWLTLPLATFYMLALSVVSHNLTLSLRQKNRELERIALMDPGLEIPNRRLFERRLESELLRTLRGDTRAYLILIDVDHFKNVNDTFGHEAGDFLLAEISGLLRDSVGMKDIPARFGGDELGVIIRDSNDVDIIRLAESLQRNIGQLRLPASVTFRCSVSIGIASADKADSIHEWLRRADKALYEVKRSGRDGLKLWRA